MNPSERGRVGVCRCTSVIQRVLEHAVQVSTDTKGIKHVSVYMRAFQFSTSDTVNFECQVRPCIHTCSMSVCAHMRARTHDVMTSAMHNLVVTNTT
jgi:hypothetical protein